MMSKKRAVKARFYRFCLIELQPFAAVDIQEVFIRIHFELPAGCLVAGNIGIVVELEGRNGPLGADAAFHTVSECSGFVVAIDQDENFSGIHNRANTDRKCSCRNFSGSLPKKRELTIFVSSVRARTPVLELREV